VNTAPKKTTHRTLASLKLPKPVPTLIVYAEGIPKAMTGNPNFPSPVPPLSALSGALADLQSAETGALARTKGAVATRNASTDGGKTWVALPPTLQARTTVTGLTPGSSAQFRHRAVTKAGAADWSLPITFPA
jgi:hypothetical protein